MTADKSTETVVEFLGCPFCGSMACTVLRRPYVECTACHARGPLGDDMAGALALWARRTPDASLLELLKELIEIEGPQPGHVMWFRKVEAAIAKAEGHT
jgi:hypothetical protein